MQLQGITGAGRGWFKKIVFRGGKEFYGDTYKYKDTLIRRCG